MRACRSVVVVLFAISSSISWLHAADLTQSDSQLPLGVVARLGVPVRSSHHQAVAIAFSQDDQLLACAGLRTYGFRDSDIPYPIEVFRTEGLTRSIVLEGGTSPIRTILIAPNNDQLASLDAVGTLQMWSLASGELLWTARQPGAKQVVFSADRKRLFATDSSERVWIVDRQTGELVDEHILVEPQPEGEAAFPGPTPWAAPRKQESGEGKVIRMEFSQKDGTMTVHEEGKEPVTINLRALGRKMSYWRRICLLPDGRNFIWLTDEGTFEVRDATTGEAATEAELETLVAIRRRFSEQEKDPSPVGLLWPSSDAQSIQVRISDVASILDFKTGRVEKTLFSWPPPASWLKGDYSLSPDIPEKRPRGTGQAKLAWFADSLAISPDGRLAALMGRREANRSEVRVIDLESEATVNVFALESRYREREIYRGPIGSSQQIRALKPVTGAFSHNGHLLAVELLGVVRLLDVETGQEVIARDRTDHDRVPISEEHEDKMAAIVFSPDGTLVATASFDSTIRVWSTATGQELLRREHIWTSASHHVVAFSRDSTLFAADLGKVVEILRCTDGEVVCRLQDESRSNTGWAVGLGFSPSGNRIATWNGSQRKVTWWDIPSGRRVRTVPIKLLPEDKPEEGPNHTDQASAQGFAFSPDMRRLATPIYLDRVFIQCDTWTGNRLHTVDSPGRLKGVCFTADMRQFVLGGDGEPFRIFDTQTGEVLKTITPSGRRRGELSGYWMNPAHDARLGITSGSGAERPQAFLKEGQLLATEDLTGTRIYDVDSGEFVGRIPDYGIRAVSADGRLAATVTIRNVSSVHGDLLTTASTVLIWDVGKLLNRAEQNPQGF